MIDLNQANDLSFDSKIVLEEDLIDRWLYLTLEEPYFLNDGLEKIITIDSLVGDDLISYTSWYDRMGLERYFLFENKYYEIIYTSGQLQEATETHFVDTIEMALDYLSASKEQYEDLFLLELTRPLIYHKQSENISDEDPRGFSWDLSDVASLSQSVTMAFISMAESLVGRPDYVKNAKGVDMIIDSFKIILDQGLGFNEKNLDVILNPSGYVVIYIKVKNSQIGVHPIIFNINGKKVTTLSYDYLEYPFILGQGWDQDKILQEHFPYYRKVIQKIENKKEAEDF